MLRNLSHAKVWVHRPYSSLTSVFVVTISEPLQPETTPLMWVGSSVLFSLGQDSSASTIRINTNDDGFQESPTQHFKPHTKGPSLGNKSCFTNLEEVPKAVYHLCVLL